MRYLILGSGMMGSALAFDLSRSEGTTAVTLADVDFDRARRTAEWIPGGIVKPVQIDVNDGDAVVKLMRGHQVAVGSVSYRLNAALTKHAIAAGVHFCDLGGNDDIVREQLAMHEAAREHGVTIIPNCGLAPGLVNILAARGAESFERVDAIRMRVGGLPKFPKPPLNYQLVFSVEGLINEYSGQSAVVRDGKLAFADALSEIEHLEFPPPLGRLEAFHTSGGASFLPQMFAGRVRELDYKTIRYPGHCERMRTLLEIGFANSEPVTVGNIVMTERELFLELLRRRIPSTGPDLVVLRVTLDGIAQGKHVQRRFELIDSQDEKYNISAMMRGTSYPTSLIAQQLAAGTICERGVFPPEQCSRLEPLLDGLRLRGVNVVDEWVSI